MQALLDEAHRLDSGGLSRLKIKKTWRKYATSAPLPLSLFSSSLRSTTNISVYTAGACFSSLTCRPVSQLSDKAAKIWLKAFDSF